MWFGKNELRLYLNRAKKFSIGGGPRGPPLNTPMYVIMSHGSFVINNNGKFATENLYVKVFRAASPSFHVLRASFFSKLIN